MSVSPSLLYNYQFRHLVKELGEPLEPHLITSHLLIMQAAAELATTSNVYLLHDGSWDACCSKCFRRPSCRPPSFLLGTPVVVVPVASQELASVSRIMASPMNVKLTVMSGLYPSPLKGR